MLLADRSFTEVLGVDVSARALAIAAGRLGLDRMPERQRDRVRLIQSSLTYRDSRFAGFDAAVLMEVIEHVDPPRLVALERVVFGHARPGTVVVTTPNAEHNVRYPDLPAGTMRHRDEWPHPPSGRRGDQGRPAGAARAGHRGRVECGGRLPGAGAG
jgi:2-polyprenyl-3-methyl-5-hydroxy-6-metoxy-1,4-benzoquinol methylase